MDFEYDGCIIYQVDYDYDIEIEINYDSVYINIFELKKWIDEQVKNIKKENKNDK